MSEHDTAARRPLDWFKRHNPLHWFKRHKKLTIFLVILLLILAFVLSQLGRTAAASKALTYQFVRTTTLQKTSLTDSVSVTGTVASGSTASVTASDSVKTYKVTAVNVAVGDTVKAGDVIATLDTSDVEKQIETASRTTATRWTRPRLLTPERGGPVHQPDPAAGRSGQSPGGLRHPGS